MTINDSYHVARLVFRLQTHDQECTKSKLIHPSEQFDIGRDDLVAMLDYTNKAISKHHFRIRCILFDEDDSSVAPIVYLQVLSRNGLLMSFGRDGTSYEHITPADGARLLNIGDTIRLTRDLQVTFESSDLSLPSTAPAPLSERDLVSNTGRFRLGSKIIGFGTYARVVVATRCTDGVQLACKVVPSPNVCEAMPITMQREVQILQALDHPNITALVKVLLSARNAYIFQELAAGGDLMSYQQSRGSLPESEVICIAYQLVQAVHYLHNKSIVHRDIKPENILLTSWQSGSRILLADFGQARYLSSSANMIDTNMLRAGSVAGTEGWQAPEMRTSLRTPQHLDYSEAVDMWSLGSVVLACLTSERPEAMVPFDGATAASDSLACLAWQCQLGAVLRRSSPRISKKAISFMLACLAIDEHKRISAEASVSHAWFTCDQYSTELDLAYSRAVQHWTPRTDIANLTEYCTGFDQQVNDRLSADADEGSAVTRLVPYEPAIPVSPSLPDFLPPRSTQMPLQC